MQQSERELLSSLSIPASAIAALSGTTPQAVSRYFADPTRLPDGTQFLISSAIQQAVQLEQAVRVELATILPQFSRALGISWKNTAAVRALIQHLQNGAASE